LQQPARNRVVFGDQNYGYRYAAEIISYAVWLYYRFSLSLRDVEELLFDLSGGRNAESATNPVVILVQFVVKTRDIGRIARCLRAGRSPSTIGPNADHSPQL
jgi:hypothetical protein